MVNLILIGCLSVVNRLFILLLPLLGDPKENDHDREDDTRDEVKRVNPGDQNILVADVPE